MLTKQSTLDNYAKKKNFKNVYMLILFLIFSGIIVFFIAHDAILLQTPPADLSIETLDEGWTISENGEVSTVTTLSQYDTDHVTDETVFTLKRRLNDDLCLAPCLLLRLPQAILSVKIDGTEIFIYNEQAESEDKMAANAHVFVPLSEEYAGKELTLTITATKLSSFYGLEPIYFGSHSHLMQFFLRQRRVPIFFGLFLLMFGVAQMVYVPVLVNNENPDMTLITGAITTFVCGLYLLSFYGFFDLFLHNPTANTLIEYISLYSMPGLMCSYFLMQFEGKLRKMYSFFVLFDELLLLIAVLLHLSGIVFVTAFLLPFNLLLCLECLSFILISAKTKNSRKKLYVDKLQEVSDLVVLFGLALYTWCYLTDGFFFWAYRVIIGRKNPYGIPFIMYGSIAFSVLLATHYFLHSICILRAKVIRQSLEEKAFTDSLTGLSNRAMCQQVMENINSKKTPFYIISMDLDRLKTVNDTLGHAEGDRLLSTFASALKESFSGATLIGRMGGDEFIVILTDGMCSEAPGRLIDLQRRLDALNAANDVLEYSVSAGCAASNETDFGTRTFDVYMLADKRMYQNKAVYKKQRQLTKSQIR